MKTVKIGLLGLGTVGGGVYKLIERQKSEMVSKTGADVEIAKILVHNRNKKREGIDESLLTDQWKDIIEDKEIDIVVEVMGGIEPAKTIITEALKARDPMQWVQRMNSIRDRAEEILREELIYV